MCIKLVMAILPGGDDMLIIGSKTLCGQLIDVMEELMAKALKSGVVETGDQVAIYREYTGGDVSARYVSMSLSAVQRIGYQRSL